MKDVLNPHHVAVVMEAASTIPSCIAAARRAEKVVITPLDECFYEIAYIKRFDGSFFVIDERDNIIFKALFEINADGTAHFVEH